MKTYLAKLSIIAFFITLAIFCGLGGRRARAYQSGPDPARTGAPGEQTCASTTGCHISFPVNSGTGTLSLNGLPANYSPNQEINLTVTLSQTGAAAFGFEITAIDDQGRFAGTFTITDGGRTQRFFSTTLQRFYISHTFNGSFPTAQGQNSWSFRWTAPAQSVGRVTFYVAGNAANGNGNESGDRIYTRNFSIQPGTTLPTVTTVSAASFQAGAASNAIEALFGTGLAASTAVATSLPLPTTLNGVQVKIRDAAGAERDAGLFFVAATQINLLVPSGTGNGTATVTVLRDGTPVGAGTLAVDTVAPGMFSANASGQGVAAAVALRVKIDGSQVAEPVAQFNTTSGRFEPIPIDLGPEGEQVFLIAFGTGYRSSALANVSSTIGGAAAEVLFAGATPGLEGLDQANIRIPRSLAGRGTVDVVFRAEGKTANTVQIAIR
jgi:uncharacterized protein (TIGR03437 family)